MRIITLPLLVFLSIVSILANIPKDPDEIHEGWMSYHVDDKTTVFMKESLNNNPKGIINKAPLPDGANDTTDNIVLQRVIDLVAQKRTEMCKANPAGEWELKFSADINGNIKIIELKAQANIIVKIKC